MSKAEHGKPAEDLIPQNIGAAWQRASQVRARKVPHTDLLEVLDWIVSVMTPAARSRLMSDLAEKIPGAAGAKQNRRKRIRAPAAKGRRKSVRTSAKSGRRKALQTPSAQERRQGVRTSARQAPVQQTPARQERRRGRR